MCLLCQVLSGTEIAASLFPRVWAKKCFLAAVKDHIAKCILTSGAEGSVLLTPNVSRDCVLQRTEQLHGTGFLLTVDGYQHCLS